MGGGRGGNLNFGATWGSGALALEYTPETIKEADWEIGRSLGAAALNYSVSDPKSGRAFRFIEGTRITDVEVFAGRGVRNKLSPAVARGLSEQVGGRPRDWKHVKGIGTLDVGGKSRKAEIHWFEASGQPKVKFKVKRWL